MRPVKIFVDSTCDLPKEYLDENNVTLIPLGVSFDDVVYRDGVDISADTLYKKVDETGKLPKTSAITIHEFTNEFKKYIDEYDILYISISSGMSSTYQNAYIASQEFEGRVVVFDSMNLSSAIGLLICKAIEFRNAGLNINEIDSKLKDYVPRVRAQFAVETLDYLYKGGRCSSLVFLFGKGLHIRPIIRVKNGKMFVYKKPRGKMKKALDELLSIFKEDLPYIELDRVMLTHSLAFESEVYLYEELSKIIPKEKIMVTKAGSVISSHCGRGTIGILYILNKEN